MPDIYRASLRQVCAMAVPFRIPKKKQPSDSCSLDMQSPLSRLQDSNSQQRQWGSVTLNGRTPHKSSSNGNVLSKDSQRSESVRLVRPSLSGDRRDLSPDSRTPGRITRTCSDNNPKEATRGVFSFKMNKHPIKISPVQVNKTPNKVSETSNFRGQCQTPTAGRDFTGNNRWRPKRASDTLLCHDENHTGASESSSFKIHRGLDPGELETCGLFHEEEETEGTQGHTQVKETQRSSTSEDLARVSQTDRKLKSTGSVCDAFKSAVSKNKNRTALNEESVSKPSSNEPSLRSGHSLQEAPARHLKASGERAATSVPVRKDTLTSPPEAKSKDIFGSFYSNKLRRKPPVSYKTYKRSKPSSTEPIVLSSDEEGADEMNDVSGSLQEQRISEGIRDAQSGNQKSPKTNAGSERSTKVEVPSIIQLAFTRLHYDTLEAQTNGTIVITDEGIAVPLKGADGEGEVAISVSCSQLLSYGVWDGGLARDGSLLSSTEEPAPSVLFLVVSDAQARLLQKELSVLHSIHTSGQACPFVLLVLTGQLEDLQAALLASLMDVIGLRYGQGSLSNSLSWSDGLNRLHCHPAG
ncbi:hypothetical protein QQF64_034414 [Cirrhinus molitorella]|uniref:Uncharacterized protein n=2 Tax=Cirrhinus molitorella TaxID=172907 RepID=A0ABR3L2G0_9TELE